MLIPMLIIFIALLLLGVPVAFTMGIATSFYFVTTGMSLPIMTQRFFGGLNSFTILCIPGFMLAGSLMSEGGITKKIIEFCNTLIGHVRGGLAIANVLASMVFAGVSGSAIADTVSIGGILIPAMKEAGYDAEFSCAVTCSSSCIGPIIPPSIPLIVAGGCLGLSVTRLFAASFVPGILFGVGMIIVSIIQAKKHNYPKAERRATFKEICTAGWTGLWALMMVAIILVGILGGVITPTEASAIAVVYGALVGAFIYKTLTWKALWKCLRDTVKAAAAVMLLVGFANAMAYILAYEQVPQAVAAAITSVTTSKFLVILLINLLLIVVGMFMESLSAILILFPTLWAVASAVGMDPIHFTVMGVLNLVIGLCTPPVGVCLFAATSIGQTKLTGVVKALVPFFISNFATLAIVCIFPQITAGVASLF